MEKETKVKSISFNKDADIVSAQVMVIYYEVLEDGNKKVVTTNHRVDEFTKENKQSAIDLGNQELTAVVNAIWQ